MMKILTAVMTLTLIPFGLAVAADEVADAEALERGADVFAICEACHGEQAEGNEDLEAPKLAGQFNWYLTTQLKNFRAGYRGTHEEDLNGQVMQGMAADLEDQEIADVVGYIMTLDADFVPEDDQ